MTPTEQYAQKREEAVELIRTHAPPRLQEPLIGLLRPAIALSATRAQDSEIPPGASKFGGAPDVPEGFEWPMWNDKPLGFLAQIDLQEVAAFDVEGLLPKSGLLLFFAVPFAWGNENRPGMWRVFWNESIFVRNGISSYSARKIGYSLTIQFADPTHTPLASVFENEDETEIWSHAELEKLWAAWHKQVWDTKLRPNQLLGSAWLNEGRWMENICQQPSTGAKSQSGSLREIDDWRLIMQMESDYNGGPVWGDAGTASFWIRKSDLAAPNFDTVWMVAESA